MNERALARGGPSPALLVPAGADRLGEHHGHGVSTIDFKVIAPDGGLLVLENTFHAKGGPPRHLHLEQDEWFYALEGESSSRSVTSGTRCGPGILCWGRAGCRTYGCSSATDVGGS